MNKDKLSWNPHLPVIDNEQFETAMKTYLDNKNVENLTGFVNALKNAKFLVPVELPQKIDPAVMEKMKRREKLTPEELPRLIPVLVANPKGERFVPMYSSQKEVPDGKNFKMIIAVEFASVLRVARAPHMEVRGILVNSESIRLIMNPSLLDLLDRVINKGEETEKVVREQAAAAGTKKKEIRMTPEQFHVFARRNVEVGLLPKTAFQEKGKLMEKLTDNGEETVCSIYKAMYKDQIPFPYEPSDFDVMCLDISDDMSVASITLPVKYMAPGICQSAYLIWNPQTDEMQYYTIEKTKTEDESKLGHVSAEGKYEIIGDAPVQGSELSAIIDMLQNKDNN